MIVNLILLGVVLFIIYLYSNYIINVRKTNLNSGIYGIIDDTLIEECENVIYLDSVYDKKKRFSHGQELCDFINSNYSNYSIYYYNAEIDGKIDSQSIINGLNELKDKGVKKINISLSSKIYSAEIQNWIQDHEDITVYASYNNKINSYDYPAMYEGVVASGVFNEVIGFKKMDVKYRTKNIISINPFKIYSGNSYLSLVSMFDGK